jgi:hypothetical protein
MFERFGSAPSTVRRPWPVLALITAAASVGLAGPATGAAGPTGSACGYHISVGLFGGPPTVRGCGQTIPPGTAASASPSVTLPPGGSGTAITAVDSNGALAAYGPAVMFSGKDTGPNTNVPPSGRLKVTVKGTTTVTATSSVLDVGHTTFTADAVASKCTATATRHTLSATITNGVVATATDGNGDPTTRVAVPSPTPANYTVRGQISNVGDSFKIVFNEHLDNGDGSYTGNGAHMYLLGPTAVGDKIIAQSRCGH